MSKRKRSVAPSFSPRVHSRFASEGSDQAQHLDEVLRRAEKKLKKVREHSHHWSFNPSHPTYAHCTCGEPRPAGLD